MPITLLLLGSGLSLALAGGVLLAVTRRWQLAAVFLVLGVLLIVVPAVLIMLSTM